MADQTKKIPRIHFKCFSEEWDEKPIGEVLTEVTRSIDLLDNEQYQLVTVKRRNEGVVSRGYLKGRDILVKNYSQLKAGDYVISKRQVVHGANGMVPRNLDKAIVSNEYMVAVGNDKLSAEFLTILSTLPGMYRKFLLSSYGIDIEKLFFDAADWKKRCVVLPKLPEQNEICSYFAGLDRMIGLHQRKHEKLVTLKKAMLKKMFPQNGDTSPEIRFKGFSEPWEEKKLNKIANKVTEKNVSKEFSETFTNSAKFGIISQRNYFDKDISNSENIGGYYVVRPGDFVYNPRVSTFAPVGPVNLNKLGRIGIMSPLYTVFRTKDIDNIFLDYFFKTECWHPFMFYNGDTGARGDRFSIKDSVFIELPIPYPSLQEQQKIGTYFRQMDELIAQHGTQVEKLKQIKTACLEKMFV